MRKILYTDAEQGALLSTFSYLYEQLSVKPLPGSLAPLASGLRPYLSLVYSAFHQMPPEFAEAPVQEAKVNMQPKDLLLAFSGGKDSLAMALLAREAGYKVTLYHIAGVNAAFTKSELEHARRLSDLLQMPLVVRELKLGKSAKFYTEHPIKNHLILAMMVQYGMPLGIATYAQANVTEDYAVSQANPDANLSDFLELYESLVPFYRQYLPSFNLYFPLRNTTHALYTIYRHNPAWLDETGCCMTGIHYRASIRRANQRRFGITPVGDSCGSCKKCAYMHLHKVAFGMVPANPGYLDNCMKALRRHIAEDAYYKDYKKMSDNEVIGTHVDFKFLKEAFPRFEQFDPAKDQFLDYLKSSHLCLVRQGPKPGQAEALAAVGDTEKEIEWPR